MGMTSKIEMDQMTNQLKSDLQSSLHATKKLEFCSRGHSSSARLRYCRLFQILSYQQESQVLDIMLFSSQQQLNLLPSCHGLAKKKRKKKGKKKKKRRMPQILSNLVKKYQQQIILVGLCAVIGLKTYSDKSHINHHIFRRCHQNAL